jgi:hypothetical protein
MWLHTCGRKSLLLCLMVNCLRTANDKPMRNITPWNRVTDRRGNIRTFWMSLLKTAAKDVEVSNWRCLSVRNTQGAVDCWEIVWMWKFIGFRWLKIYSFQFNRIKWSKMQLLSKSIMAGFCCARWFQCRDSDLSKKKGELSWSSVTFVSVHFTVSVLWRNLVQRTNEDLLKMSMSPAVNLKISWPKQCWPTRNLKPCTPKRL